MRWPAAFLHRISGGKITPNHVTLVSTLGHIGFVWALWHSRPIMAAIILAVFGIMDTLDGALARLQKSTSVKGMLYDAVSDRLKEVMVYTGIAIFLDRIYMYTTGPDNYLLYNFYGLDMLFNALVMLPVIACGLSLLVSYIKAKGEMALSTSTKLNAQEINRVFSDGFARYEVRMAIIILGLLTGSIITALHILIVLLLITCLQRIIKVSRALRNV